LKAYVRSGMSVLLFLAILQVLVSCLAQAQDARGMVRADSLPVYAAMSPDSDVVYTLAHGSVVRITISMTSGDGSWCGISDIGSSAKLGYVRCNELDRQNLPSAATSGGGDLSSAHVDGVVANQPRSRDQEHWALAATAILATFNREPLNSLSSGGSTLSTKLTLQNWWGISNRDDLLRTLDWIDQGGHRQMFSTLGARTSNLSPDELSKAIGKLSPEDANSILVAHRYNEKYAAQSITGWDYARYINLCRWGVAAGYISEEEAWAHAMHAAAILQQTFTSWSEFGENYLVGREFWSLRQTKIDGQAMRTIYRKLLNDPDSPWRRIPWSLPLQPSGSTSLNSPNVPPGAQSVNSTAASSVCDGLRRDAASGQVSDAESILQTGSDSVNCRDSRGWTSLHYAAFNGQTKMIQIFVAHGADVDAIDNDGATPLHVAASTGHPDTIEALLQNGARIEARDHNGDTPLTNATSAGSAPATDVLLRHHASTEVRCCSHGGMLLNNAAFRGYADVVRLLLEHGAKIESRDDDGFTPLSTAAWYGQAEVVAILLEAHANVNTKAKNGATPLHGAAAKGFIESATLLLEHGAIVNAGDLHGFTPLHSAASNDQSLVAELLIARGAKMNARTDAGDTPLHWAAFNGRIDTATLLLAKGAEVNPGDKDGNTPLHWAAARGHIEMAELLIAHGADMNAKTRFGCTPLRGAYDYHQAAMAQVLLRHRTTQ
jgi:ankyrin repeat protein